jgi:5-methylcytosine-specific restriction endonuclease McrA
MAVSRTKVCAQSGCPELTTTSHCPDHTPKPWANSTRAKRLPLGWDKTRRRILERDGHTCRACLGVRCGNRQLEVDHVVNNDDHSDANLRTIGHDPCHIEKTRAESRAGRAQGWG